jgi:hypothetical protein
MENCEGIKDRSVVQESLQSGVALSPHLNIFNNRSDVMSLRPRVLWVMKLL